MGKFKTLKCHYAKPSGGYQDLKIDISIDAKGHFYAKIPDELMEYAEKYDKENNKNTNAWLGPNQKVFSKQLESVEYFLIGMNKLQANDSVKHELVIVYAINNQVSYYKHKNIIYPNGEIEDDRHKSVGSWQGGIEGMNQVGNYSVQVYAKVVNKISQSSSDKVKWDNPAFGTKELGEHGEKLNSFTHLGWPKDSDSHYGVVKIEDCVQIPYTEERAKFFYDMLLGMCKLADKFSVLQDEKVLLKLADSGKFLLTMDTTKDKS
jgi:hypothetical protein